MREIKYNVLTQDNKYLKNSQYNHIKEIHYSPGGTSINHIIWAIYQGDSDWTFHRVDNPKLISSTGLKDKNGVEIYEGDIVKINYSDYNDPHGVSYFNQKDIILTVNFEEGCFGFCDTSPKDYEVIGNIYQNPELIK